MPNDTPKQPRFKNPVKNLGGWCYPRRGEQQVTVTAYRVTRKSGNHYFALAIKIAGETMEYLVCNSRGNCMNYRTNCTVKTLSDMNTNTGCLHTAAEIAAAAHRANHYIHSRSDIRDDVVRICNRTGGNGDFYAYSAITCLSPIIATSAKGE